LRGSRLLAQGGLSAGTKVRAATANRQLLKGISDEWQILAAIE
jgi:hypothetical protein